ncbi:MAG: energy-coupling factor transporter ATPase [Eubacteriales bacterium]|nr:energy-coupling factor transporter ATPase [Clostridiales bacterium]MDY5732207.1 energy-coupling factor transporter ATPase [Eubacteriales bacterium]
MICIDNISFKYDEAGAYALKNVSFEINSGEMIAIVGHNGSGKSTLAKHLNGLLLPTEGDVRVDGDSTRDENALNSIRRRVGMVFQNPDNQIVTTVVEEDVGFGPENIGVPTDEILERVDEALKAVRMTEYAKSAPHMLSGGQKQRVAIAGILALRPKTLVLDEATAMLDPIGRREVLETVSEQNKRRGITVVMITQYMEEALLCDRVAVMSGGELKMLDTPRNIFKRVDELRALGLDAPIAVSMRDRLIKEGFPISDSIIGIDELAEALCPLLSKN